MAEPQRILITGATGALGPRVVEACVEAGLAVRVLSRRAPPVTLLPGSVDVCLGDVTDAASVRRAVEGVSGVLHLAALLHVMNPSPKLVPRYEVVNAGGTRLLVDEAAAAGVRHVVLFSTINVYGATGGRIVTEEDTPAPVSVYARSKLSAEEMVLGARGQDGTPIGTVLRLSAVYGGRMKGNYVRLLEAIRRRRFVHIGSGRNRRTLVYDRDAARAAMLVLFNPAAMGQVYNVTDGTFHTLNEIVATMASALGVAVPRWRVPVLPLNVAAPIVDVAARLLGQAPTARHALATLTEDVAVDAQRIRRQLGFEPRTSLSAGWSETVRQMYGPD